MTTLSAEMAFEIGDIVTLKTMVAAGAVRFPMQVVARQLYESHGGCDRIYLVRVLVLGKGWPFDGAKQSNISMRVNNTIEFDEPELVRYERESAKSESPCE